MEASTSEFAVINNNISISSIFNLSFSVIKSSPILFLCLSLINFMPYLGIAKPEYHMGTWLPLTFIAPLLIFTLMGQGMVSYAVFQSLSGEKIRAGASLWRVISRVPTMFLTSLLFGLIIYGLSSLLVLIMSFLPLTPAIERSVFFGGFLAMFTALFCRLVVVLQVCVVEKAGPLKSLNRSSDLTGGNRLKILALLIIVGMVIIAFNWAGSRIIEVIAAKATIIFYTNALLKSIVFAFVWIIQAVLYFELRRVNEGISIDNMANIFD